MFPPDVRSLSGDFTSAQHLFEIRLAAEERVLPLAAGETNEHVLLLCLQGAAACLHAETTWRLETNQVAWVSPFTPITLRPDVMHPCEMLIWRFRAAALPAEFHPLLPQPARPPAHGPVALTPSMQTLTLALRGCPVAPALRTLWGTGKLIEFLTLLLPPPADPVHAPVARVLHPAIKAAIHFMTAHLGEPIGLPQLAAAAHTSPWHLSRLFTAEFGHGPTVHLRRLRLGRAATLLRSGQTNVTEAALAVGYQSLGQFSRSFAEHHGAPPSTLRQRHPS